MTKKRQIAVITAVSFFLVGFFFIATGMIANAQGILPDEVVEGAQLLYQKYPFSHYMLDYQATDKFSLDIFGSVKAGILEAGQFAITQGIWLVSTLITRLGMFLLNYAYDFDFVERVIGILETCMRRLLGVTENGFTGSGFFGRLLVLTLIGLGAYLVVTGVLKRQFSKAYSVLLNYLVVFVFALVFTLGAGTYITAINNLSNSISAEILNIGNDMVRLAMNGQETSFVKTDNVTDSVKELLFEVQIRNPWIILEFGDSNVDESRIEAIESRGLTEEDRLAAVEDEIEEHGNEWVTNSGNTMIRLVYALLLLVVNIIITMFVLFLALLMIASKIMFLLFMFLMPIFFIAGLIPGNHKVAYNGVIKAFNCLLTNLVINLVLTISFILSAICYYITSDMPYLVTLILQAVCFYAVYRSLGKINDLIGFGNMKESAQKVRLTKERIRDASGVVAAKGARLAMSAATKGASEQRGESREASEGKKAEEQAKQVMKGWNEKSAKKARSRSDIYSDMSSYGEERGKEGQQQKKNDGFAFDFKKRDRNAGDVNDKKQQAKETYREDPTVSMKDKPEPEDKKFSLYEEKKKNKECTAEGADQKEPTASIEEYKKQSKQEPVQPKRQETGEKTSVSNREMERMEQKPKRDSLASVQESISRKKEQTVSGSENKIEPTASIEKYKQKTSIPERETGQREERFGADSLASVKDNMSQKKQWPVFNSGSKVEPAASIEEYKHKRSQSLPEKGTTEESSRKTGMERFEGSSESAQEYTSMADSPKERGEDA